MVVLVAPGCGREDGPRLLELHGRTMGTTYSVQIAGAPAELSADAIQQRIDAELKDVNAQMSTYDPNSNLSQFNQSKSTDWFPVPVDLAGVTTEAQAISRLSGGAFDVTVGRLVNLWGFGPDFHPDRVPPDAAIADDRALTGFEKLSVRLDPPAMRKQLPGMDVDLSAIAKGYGVDQVAGVLDQLGLTDYLVEIGGELRARGQRPDRLWRIAIERPESGERAVFRVVTLHDVGMATSGDYRNFFEQGGVFYSHTIDPHTGRPVTHRLASVTVLDPLCMRADALATALMVLGPEAGLELAESQGIPAFFIERLGSGDYRPSMTSAFEQVSAVPSASE